MFTEHCSAPWVISLYESKVNIIKSCWNSNPPYFILWPRGRHVRQVTPNDRDWHLPPPFTFPLISSPTPPSHLHLPLPPSHHDQNFGQNQLDLSLHKLSSARFISFPPPTHRSHHITNVIDVSFFSSAKREAVANYIEPQNQCFWFRQTLHSFQQRLCPKCRTSHIPR